MRSRAKKGSRRLDRLRLKGSPSYGKEINARAQRETFLIVCEGAKTEPNYFRKFGSPADVKVVGAGKNTFSLILETVAQRDKGNYDQVWAVFDRDSFPAQSFNNALSSAREEEIHVAYTNEAFELWYLLHFDYHDAALSRTQYGKKLEKKLGRPYKKNDVNIYRDLQSRQPIAIANAKRLLAQWGHSDPANQNPSTTVHVLVEELNKNSRDSV